MGTPKSVVAKGCTSTKKYLRVNRQVAYLVSLACEDLVPVGEEGLELVILASIYTQNVVVNVEIRINLVCKKYCRV